MRMMIGLLIGASLSAAAPLRADCERGAAEAKVAELTSMMTSKQASATPSAQVALARQAVALCDTWAGAHNALGTALEAAGDVAGADASYRRASQIDPKWALPVLGLGDLAKARGNASEAQMHYDRARGMSETESGAGYQFATAETITKELATGLGASRAPRWADSGPVDNSKSAVRDKDGVRVNLSVVFAQNSASLLPDGIRQLDEVGRALQGAGAGEVYVLEGHASSEGSPDHNMDLSRRRAEAVKAYLQARFPAKAQLMVMALGSSSPVLENGSENPLKSRRVGLLRKQ